jgi:signal transduction histidine kinase/ActR/RegA family two-component response regulator
MSAISVLLDLAFRSFEKPVALVGDSGIVLRVNEAFERLNICSASDLGTSSLFDLCTPLPGEDPIEWGRMWSGRVKRGQVDAPGPTLEIVIEPLYLAGGVCAGHVVRVAREFHSDLLDESSSSFRQKKLESLGVLASSIAHDLNNLLTGVLGHVSYLRLSRAGLDADLESIAAIEDGARRAASMTQQILEFARGGEVELSTVNMSLLVAAGINLFRASLPDTIVFNFIGGESDLFVYGNEGQLSQLVLNLLVNAQDALGDSGEIAVCLSQYRLDEATKFRNGLLEAGEYARFSIQDNGHGIPESLIGRIFEPFFTTKAGNSDRRGGTGLGLATVSAMVRAHRGLIDVSSEVEKGTRFDVLLPLCTALEEVEEVPQSLSEEPALPLGQERVLVIDDEEAVRTVIQRSLEHLGYEVIVASNGKDALEIYREQFAHISLVILDMIMPHMPGDEVFYELQAISPDVAVLIASGYSSDGRTKAVLRDGGLGFIQKPFAVEELAQEVRRCIDESHLS